VVRIEGKKLFIVMVNIKGDVRLDSNEIKKKNLELVDYFMATYNPQHIELNEKGYFYFANINSYNQREVINNIFKHSPNPSIVSFLINNCRNINLSIPEEHVDSILIKYNFYFLWYFQQPEPRTYFLTVSNTNNVGLVNPLLQGEILWVISAYTPTYYNRLSDFIIESYSSVLPLALNEIYFSSMLSKFKGMGYIESENYTDICNINKKVKFRSIIFTNKIEELPLFEDELYLNNSRNLYMTELSGHEKYLISRGELKMLKSLLSKDVEYGGLYDKAKIDSVKVEGKEITRYNLYTSSPSIRGEEKGVLVPISDVNYHSHPNYCTSKHKLIVAWPSGLDMKIISSEASLFTTHIKTHLCITSNGIFFIKLTPKFYNFIQTLTMSCKNILFNLVELYFKGIQDLRNIEEISKKFGLEQDYKENIEKQLKNPEQCIQTNINFFTTIINDYLLNINKVTLKDIFDYTKYKTITASQKTKIEIQAKLRDLIYDITTDFFCEESIKKGEQDYPLYIIKFSNWDALLQNTYYEFD